MSARTTQAADGGPDLLRTIAASAAEGIHDATHILSDLLRLATEELAGVPGAGRADSLIRAADRYLTDIESIAARLDAGAAKALEGGAA